ncbi:hypothetical protein ACA910_012522 [Epithemia clementina (nom. ined.)]
MYVKEVVEVEVEDDVEDDNHHELLDPTEDPTEMSTEHTWEGPMVVREVTLSGVEPAAARNRNHHNKWDPPSTPTPTRPTAQGQDEGDEEEEESTSTSSSSSSSSSSSEESSRRITKTMVPTSSQSKYDDITTTTSTTLVEPPRWCIVQPSSEEDDSWNKKEETKIRTPRWSTTTTIKNEHDDNHVAAATTKRRDHAEPRPSKILWRAQQYEQRARANKLSLSSSSSLLSQQKDDHETNEWIRAQRRQYAYQWYMRHGMPNRRSMLDQIERGIPLRGAAAGAVGGLCLTQDDVLSLPWIRNGALVDATTMMAHMNDLYNMGHSSRSLWTDCGSGSSGQS